MKYLNVFENFNETQYYKFDVVKFYNDFKEIYDIEKKDNNSYSGYFFDHLNSLYPNYKNITKELLIENIIRDILKDKKIKFTDKNGDIIHISIVKNPEFYYSKFFKTFSFAIDSIPANYRIPFTIYDKPTEIEELVDFCLDKNKYNL